MKRHIANFLSRVKTGSRNELIGRAGIVLAVVAIAFVGVQLTFGSHAATPFASLETEDGTRSNGAVAVNDATASGGSAVKFSTAVNPPPGGGLDFPANPTFQQSSVSQYGVTYNFDRNYTVGQFANGDWWVVGPITLTGIAPASNTGTKANGENINPKKGDVGYDGGLDGPFMSLTFPRSVAVNSSIVKGVDRPSGYGDAAHRGLLKTATVLTVVSAPPVKNGATVFRPPYFEADKPQYLTTDLNTNLLPTMTLPAGSWASLDTVAAKFQRVGLDHDVGNEQNRMLHPVDNLQDYGSKLSQDSNFAALRLMMNDPISAKAQALINYLQYGIDLSAMYKYNSHVGSAGNCGGHCEGRTLPLVMAATLLNSAEIKGIINAEPEDLIENGGVWVSANAPTPLFGEFPCSKSEYDTVHNGGSGSKTCEDPYGGYIDGGKTPGEDYQFCCTTQPWKGAVTAVWLMPALQPNWPKFNEISEYVDRWVDFGVWTKPDPQNRFLSLHGTKKDQGYYDTPLAGALWTRENLSNRITKNYAAL